MNGSKDFDIPFILWGKVIQYLEHYKQSQVMENFGEGTWFA